MRKLWIAVAALVLLSPLGLIIPAKLGAGSAWGEWSAQELKALVGYVPSQLGRLSGLWKAPLPDYALKGRENAGLRPLCGSYLLSAIVGVALVLLAAFLVGRLLHRKDDTDAARMDGE